MTGRPWYQHPAIPYVVPFAVFILLLETAGRMPLSQRVEFGLRVVVLTTVLWVFSRKVIDLGVSRPIETAAVGIGVFLIWIGPDVLFPGYRHHWLFENSITGQLNSSLGQETRQDALALVLRTVRAVVLVPIIEELFWRGWLMRYLIRHDFLNIPLGTYARSAFWGVALLFAAEHGPYWDVGLIAGLVYNFWMCRTKRLGDVIWAHAITNGLLCIYVLVTGKWEYWF